MAHRLPFSHRTKSQPIWLVTTPPEEVSNVEDAVKKLAATGAVIMALSTGRAIAQPTATSSPAEKAPPSKSTSTSTDKPSSKPTPWAKGVSATSKKDANHLREEANALFLEKSYAAALKKYRQALAAWDHPAIRFAIARVLIRLDKPVEAYDNIEASLRHGAEPLDHLFEDAQNYKRLLDNQIATLKVSCAQDDVSIFVDGQAFLSCPGHRSIRLRSGNHQIVGEKAGHLPLTKELELRGGTSAPVEVKLLSTMTTVRYWEPSWLPWTIVGAGAAVGLVGAVFEWQALSTRGEYADLLTNGCSHAPCRSDFAKPTLDRAQRYHGIGVTGLAVGGTAIVTGLIGLILNEPREVPRTPDDNPQIIPTVTVNSAGVSIIGSY